jgi:hypothetical protein
MYRLKFRSVVGWWGEGNTLAGSKWEELVMSGSFQKNVAAFHFLAFSSCLAPVVHGPLCIGVKGLVSTNQVIAFDSTTSFVSAHNLQLQVGC